MRFMSLGRSVVYVVAALVVTVADGQARGEARVDFAIQCVVTADVPVVRAAGLAELPGDVLTLTQAGVDPVTNRPAFIACAIDRSTQSLIDEQITLLGNPGDFVLTFNYDSNTGAGAYELNADQVALLRDDLLLDQTTYPMFPPAAPLASRTALYAQQGQQLHRASFPAGGPINPFSLVAELSPYGMVDDLALSGQGGTTVQNASGFDTHLVDQLFVFDSVLGDRNPIIAADLQAGASSVLMDIPLGEQVRNRISALMTPDLGLIAAAVTAPIGPMTENTLRVGGAAGVAELDLTAEIGSVDDLAVAFRRRDMTPDVADLFLAAIFGQQVVLYSFSADFSGVLAPQFLLAPQALVQGSPTLEMTDQHVILDADDLVLGQSVDEILIGSLALDGQGNLAVRVRLADGSEATVISTIIPEPAAIVLLPTIAWLRPRRRRTGRTTPLS